MLQIFAYTQTRYKALLVKKAIPERYHFIKKLREKNQTEQQQKQAYDAISISHETGATHSGEYVTFKKKNAIISTKKEELKTTF